MQTRPPAQLISILAVVICSGAKTHTVVRDEQGNRYRNFPLLSFSLSPAFALLIQCIADDGVSFRHML